MMVYEDPELFKAIVDKLGGLLEEYNRRLLEFDGVSIIFQGEDFGAVSQLLLPPDIIREYFFPWHTKYAKMCHDAGRPYFLHSCGEVTAIMDGLIDEVKIDAKHSFDSKSSPVVEYKKRYGDQIAILGGVDVHVLASASPEEVRKHTRSVIEACAPGGRFAIGSGNSIPSYISVENYLTMMDECLNVTG